MLMGAKFREIYFANIKLKNYVDRRSNFDQSCRIPVLFSESRTSAKNCRYFSHKLL